MSSHCPLRYLASAGMLLVAFSACAEPKPLADGANSVATSSESNATTTGSAPSSGEAAPVPTDASAAPTTSPPVVAPPTSVPQFAAIPGSTTNATPPGTASALALPEHFPEDFPTYRAGVIERVSEAGQPANILFKTPDQPQQVLAYFAEALQAKGWQDIDSRLVNGQTEEVARAYAYKDDRVVMVDVEGASRVQIGPSSGTTVYVSITTLPQELPEDVPAPPRAKLRGGGTGVGENKQQSSFTFETAEPRLPLYEYYVNELTARGWEDVLPNTLITNHGWVTAKKGERELMVEIYTGLEARRRLREGESSVRLIISEPAPQ